MIKYLHLGDDGRVVDQPLKILVKKRKKMGVIGGLNLPTLNL